MHQGPTQALFGYCGLHLSLREGLHHTTPEQSFLNRHPTHPERTMSHCYHASLVPGRTGEHWSISLSYQVCPYVTIILKETYDYLYFTDNETTAQRSKIICSRAHNQHAVESRFNSGLSHSKPKTLPIPLLMLSSLEQASSRGSNHIRLCRWVH